MDNFTKAAQELAHRRQVRRDFASWCRSCGFEPARHHLYLIDKITAAVDRKITKLMINMPPGSAKSTYTSKLLPGWFLGRCPTSNILACSCSADLAAHFGREARNFLLDHEKELAVQLRRDSQAADEWGIKTGGLFFCAGVGAKIAGRRADLALIDDPVGSREEAFSKTYRDKTWNWYNTDFKTRLKPNAVIILIQTRWHEDDLAGRLLATEPDEWTVVKLPMIAKENDQLGRAPGELLWDDYFTQEMVTQARKDAATWSALYQQDPTPEDGDFFRREHIEAALYDRNELPPLSELRVYASSDHAVSEEQRADNNTLMLIGVDHKGVMWILPELEHGKWDTFQTVEKMITLIKKYRPITWWAEKDHIGRSIGPFLFRRQFEEAAWCNIEQVLPHKDKTARAQSFQGRLKMGMVRIPRYVTWYPTLLDQMLKFPAGIHDDLIDPLSLFGMGLDKVVGGRPTPALVAPSYYLAGKPLTLGYIKENTRERELAVQFDKLHN